MSHTDPELVEAVRRGRASEFASIADAGPPDPQAEQTFTSAMLDWAQRRREPHAVVLEWYRALLSLRANRSALRLLDPSLTTTQVLEDERALVVRRGAPDDLVVIVLAFDDLPHDIELRLGSGVWTPLLDTHPGERGLPETIDVDGGLRLKLPARSALVLGS